MTRLTRTGEFFVGVLVLLYLASLTSQSGLLLLLVGIVLGCYLVNYFGARRAVRSLEIAGPASVHVSEGEAVSEPWTLINRDSRPAGFILAEGPQGVLFRITSVPGKTSINLAPVLKFSTRGVHEWSDVQLASFHPFGMLKAGRRLKLPGEVVVYPAVYHTAPPTAAGYDAMVGGKLRGRRGAASGGSFAGVRPFQHGDALKQIHWKSSAKGRGLMVRIFDEELSGRVAVVLDNGNQGDTGLLDDAVRAAGSLMFAALDAGNHVEWVDLERRQIQLVPPFSDGHELLDGLARVPTRAGCLTAERLAEALGLISSRAAIAFVLTDFNALVREAINGLLSRGRVVSVYLPERHAIPGEMVGVRLSVYSAGWIQEPG
jgi:uncharacterized protein (DUF58 family)